MMVRRGTVVMYDGEPKPEAYWVGTRNQRRRKRDRWGVLRKGEVRFIRAELSYRGKGIGTLEVPTGFFGQRSRILLKIKAEIFEEERRGRCR